MDVGLEPGTPWEVWVRLLVYTRAFPRGRRRTDTSVANPHGVGGGGDMGLRKQRVMCNRARHHYWVPAGGLS